MPCLSSRGLFAFGLLLLCAVVQVKASDDVDTVSTYVQVKADSVSLKEHRYLDSLLFVWQTPKRWFKEQSIDNATYLPSALGELTDEDIREELALIPTVIPLQPHPEVMRYVRYFIRDRRRHVAYMKGLSEHYFPVIEEVLHRHNMPHELTCLPVIESALQPQAKSPMGAAGLWQFMVRTAKHYDLEVNSLVDERRNIYQATEAAIKYLQSMHKLYDDWLLALAAYNAGPGNVNKAVARAGGVKDYWAIRPFLPKETQAYVPLFLACVYSMEYADKYGIPTVYPADELFVFDTVRVYKSLDLAIVSSRLKIDSGVLAYLNPMFYRGKVPAREEGYPLALPVQSVSHFIEEEQLLYALCEEKFVVPEVAPVQVEGQTTYTVKQGDNLGYIAQLYDVRVSDIKRWNNMRGHFLQIGDKLVIYSNKKPSTATVSASPQSNKPVGVRAEDMDPLTCGCKYHVIEAGDTLWDIAQAYDTTIDAICADNNMTTNTRLKVGMVLKIANR